VIALLVFGLIGWSIAVLSVMAAWDWRNRYEQLKLETDVWVRPEQRGTVEFGESNVALTAARLREQADVTSATEKLTNGELRALAVAMQRTQKFEPW
jgi:hypothetical protein